MVDVLYEYLMYDSWHWNIWLQKCFSKVNYPKKTGFCKEQNAGFSAQIPSDSDNLVNKKGMLDI